MDKTERDAVLAHLATFRRGIQSQIDRGDTSRFLAIFAKSLECPSAQLIERVAAAMRKQNANDKKP